MTSKLVVNTIEADTGISSVSFASSISLSSTSKFFFSDAGINIGPDTNINRPASGVLGFNINSSEKLRITSDGKIGINSAAPNTHLDVIASSANRTYTPGSSVVSMFERNGHCRIAMVAGSSSYSSIDFADTNDDNAGYIRYDHSDNSMSFRTNGTGERLRITSAGLVGIGTDNPLNPLEVWGSSVDLAIMDTQAYSQNSSGPAVGFQGYDSAGVRKTFADIRGVANGSNIGEFAIRTRRTGGTLTEALRIDSAGNVGVGTNVASDTTGNCQAFKIARPVNGQVRLIIQNAATGFGNGAGFQQGIDGANVFIENRTSGGFIDFANVDSGGTYYTRMRISSEGFVTKPYQAMFEAGGNNIAFSAQSPLPYPTVKYNIGNCYNNSTYKFTAPVNGYYQVMAHVIPTDYTAGGNNVELYVMDNHGTRYFLDRDVKSTNFSSNNFSVGGTRIIYADATDTLWLQFHAISGTPKVETASYFSAILVA